MRKIDANEYDFLNGNEFYHVTSKGEVLKGNVTKVRGENYISTEHTCPCGKDTYDTYENAVKALKLRNKKKKDIYKCSICGYWHFTSKDGNHKRSKKYDKRTRNKPINVVDRDLKELQAFKKKMKNRPSYYRVINNNVNGNKTQQVKLAELCDYQFDLLKNKFETK